VFSLRLPCCLKQQKTKIRSECVTLIEKRTNTQFLNGYCRLFPSACSFIVLVFAVFHYMFRLTWPRGHTQGKNKNNERKQHRKNTSKKHTVIRTYAKKHKNRTAQNNNQLIRDLLNQPEIGRRLSRMWPEDLIR
jgi:hypothetical protein